MEKIDLLYDHYKESFSLSKEAQNQRNKHFVVLCILEAFSFMFITNPQKATELINKGVESQLEIVLPLGLTVIQTLLWILIAYVMIRYVQDVMYIERQYSYLDGLEKEIDDILGKKRIFGREGQAYYKDYPIVLNLIDLFYKMLMPILFAGINLVRIIMEWRVAQYVNTALICDTAMFTAIFIITWFFFFEIHPKITGLAKKYVPLVDKIAIIIRKILKEV